MELLIIISFAIHLIPAIVALSRGHHSRWSIVVVNVFLGWSVIGWIVALAWSVGQVKGRAA